MDGIWIVKCTHKSPLKGSSRMIYSNGHDQRPTYFINSIATFPIPRKQGRPRKTWSECVKTDVSNCGLAGVDPQDRDACRVGVRHSLVLPTPIRTQLPILQMRGNGHTEPTGFWSTHRQTRDYVDTRFKQSIKQLPLLLRRRDILNFAWMINHINRFMWGPTTHLCRNFNGSLVELPSTLRHGWVHTPHRKPWVWLCMYEQFLSYIRWLWLWFTKMDSGAVSRLETMSQN